MKRRAPRLACMVAAFVLSCAALAHAYEPSRVPVSPSAPKLPEGALYKGLVGNALELLPLEPDVRVDLQRVNALVSSPLSGRSLALLLGISSPVLIIPGLVWGIWSALNIKVPKPDTAKWLGSRREHLGFCARGRVAACELPLQDVTAPSDGDVLIAGTGPDSDTVALLAQGGANDLSVTR